MGRLIEFLKRLKSKVLRGREEAERIEKRRAGWHREIVRYKAMNLPKPGSQAARKDLSRFFKGKGKKASWYRKQIKRKVKVEEGSDA